MAFEFFGVASSHFSVSSGSYYIPEYIPRNLLPRLWHVSGGRSNVWGRRWIWFISAFWRHFDKVSNPIYVFEQIISFWNSNNIMKQTM